MNFLGPNITTNLKLLSRSEGKIKSYKSCVDVRAWSHNERDRVGYLREWIKRDMPICVLPICTLAKFFSAMTCKSRGRIAPRCHPDCKSRVLLESLCKSCLVINECLRGDPSFDKYFAEEEINTSHWPCDRCLDVLKSVKMFWKIIIEKVFGINLSKSEDFDNVQDARTESIKSVAKMWEKEMTQQAVFVKSVAPLINKEFHGDGSKETLNKLPTRVQRPITIKVKDHSHLIKSNNAKSSISSMSGNSKTIDSGKNSSFYRYHSSRSKLHRGNCVRVKTADVSSDTSDLNYDELISYQQNVELLQRKCNNQENEIERLRNENNSLKIELNTFYKTNTSLWSSRSTARVPSNANVVLLPKPFDCCLEEGLPETSVNNAESEMIITMKNCTNESFKHVSLLQVLHKTNLPLIDNESPTISYCEKENPLDLLTKVQNAFGEIVNREIRIVTTNKPNEEHDIHASLYRPTNSKSAPSCSTMSAGISSESNYASL